jgi:hypothetical protein
MEPPEFWFCRAHQKPVIFDQGAVLDGYGRDIMFRDEPEARLLSLWPSSVYMTNSPIYQPGEFVICCALYLVDTCPCPC